MVSISVLFKLILLPKSSSTSVTLLNFHEKMAVKIIENDNGLEGLTSKKSTQRLNQIDRIREFSVGEHVSLPQIAVCGDQSSGKSSGLERVTGIPFPRKDGVCTKFPTEVILRHSTETSRITATIIPTSARSEADKVLLRAYRKELDDFTELPDVILEAGTLMRIRGYGVNEGPAFAADVLRIEVVGNTGLHLTVVDLPGLIAVENDEQTEEDIALVDTLVDAYLKSSRTIILAVVQANNDIANQSIIRRARKFDRDGQRTVGIITKPDLINKGTEGRIASLAKNESSMKLKLGFFLLKNPSPSQLESGMSRSEQIHQEVEFFASWKEHRLDLSRVGIVALQHFLQDLHSRHIEKELPMVRREITALLTKIDGSLTSLGEQRQTPSDIRMFLARLSMKFHDLTQAAIDGNYSDGDFFAGSNRDSSTRLRADIHCLNGEFSTYMRDKGHLRKLCSVSKHDVGSESDVDSEEEGETMRVAKHRVETWVKQV